MLCRSRKPEKNPLEKNSGTCSRNHAAATSVWSLDIHVNELFTLLWQYPCISPKGILPKKQTKLEILFVGTGVERLHHVPYVLLYHKICSIVHRTISLWCTRAAKIYISFYFMLFIRQKINNFVFTLTHNEKRTFSGNSFYLGCLPVPYSDKLHCNIVREQSLRYRLGVQAITISNNIY